MKVSSSLVLFVVIGFVFLVADIKAVDRPKVYNRTDIENINVLFRTCVRECTKSDSRDERTECTVQCTKKYRLPKPSNPKKPTTTPTATTPSSTSQSKPIKSKRQDHLYLRA